MTDLERTPSEDARQGYSNPNLRKVPIPKQDFRQRPFRPFLDKNITENLRQVFDLFCENDRVNPNNIKNALRKVDFHKNSPQIYKVLEDLCLDFDLNGEKPISFTNFIDFLNNRLGDNNSRIGTNKVFENLMDPKLKEITPKGLFNLINELGDEISLEDVKYILERVSEPSLDINITADEFYYIMTKKPSDVDLVTPVTKQLSK